MTYNKGDILKSKLNTPTNKMFVMLTDQVNTMYWVVVLFNNLNDVCVGDTTNGIDIEDLEISSINEMATFIVSL